MSPRPSPSGAPQPSAAGALPVPAAPNEITPAWLTTVLRGAGVLRRGSVTMLRWETIGEDRGFTGVVARLHPHYAGTAPAAPVPPSLIAKLPTAERHQPSAYRTTQQRDPVAVRRHYERCAREVRFYRELAPISPVPAPHHYHGAADDADGHVVLLLEDLATARVGDALRGCSPEDALLVVEAIAPFHARWWEQARPDSVPWLPRWGGDHRARQERYDRQAGPFLERYGHLLPAPVRDLVDRLRGRYAAVSAALDRAPPTIIHADLHLDNVLFNPTGTAPRAVVLDWQGVATGAAAVDIASFVVGSLCVAGRRTAEDGLLARYHALLAAHGVTGYPVEDLRRDYRLALLCHMAGNVGWLASTDTAELKGRERDLVDAAFGDGRLVTALLDHGATALLPP